MLSATISTPELPADLGDSCPREKFVVEAEREHIRVMLSVARRYLNSEDLCWDAVQESLLALFTIRPEELPRPESLRGWLLRAVRLRSLHLARTLHRRRIHEEACACLRCLALVCELSEAVELNELVRSVRREMAQLPQSQREILEMRDFLGLEYSDISERLRLPIGTVRSRLHRARATIRKRLMSSQERRFSCAS